MHNLRRFARKYRLSILAFLIIISLTVVTTTLSLQHQELLHQQLQQQAIVVATERIVGLVRAHDNYYNYRGNFVQDNSFSLSPSFIKTANAYEDKLYGDDGYDMNIVHIGNKVNCPAQSDSIVLKGKIPPKSIMMIADYTPCELKDGRAIFNIPEKEDLKIAFLSVDADDDEKNDGVLVDLQKVQSLQQTNGLFIVDFDSSMEGEDPITGEKKTLDNINELALFNDATSKSIDFKAGNSLALTSILK